MKNSRAQEEMVGFILIVLLITIVGLIFLGISLRKPSTAPEQRSELVDSFIKSISIYTTDCQFPPTYYKTIEDVIDMCESGLKCSDERDSCLVVKETLKKILNQSFIVSNGSYVKYYELKITKENEMNIGTFEPILVGKKESCPSSKLFNERLFTDSNNNKVKIRLEVCYNVLG